MDLQKIENRLDELEEISIGFFSDISPEKKRYMEGVNIARQLLAVIRREGTSVTVDSVSVVEEKRKEVKRESFDGEEFMEPTAIAGKKKIYKAVENTEEEQQREREFIADQKNTGSDMSRDEKIILEMSDDIRKKDLIIESMYEHIEGAKIAKEKNKEIAEKYNALIRKHGAMVDLYKEKDKELSEFYDKLIKANDLIVKQSTTIDKYESSWVVKKFLK